VKNQIEARREELKQKLATIRDERKKQTTERIGAELQKLNERITAHFSNVLEKIENALERVNSRADKAEANNRDVRAVRTAISEAETAITDARTAASAQAGKVYTLEVTTEDALRVDVGRARQTLHTDLSAVREKVKAAHEAVRKAAVSLAQIPKVDELEVEASAEASATTE